MSALGTINCHFREGSKDRFDFLMRQISAELPALLATLPRAPTYQGREGEVTTIQNIMECWEKFADIDWLAHTRFSGTPPPVLGARLLCFGGAEVCIICEVVAWRG